MKTRVSKSILPVLFFFLLFSFPVEAAHIIGGEMSYSCIGGSNYLFTLKLYRDCQGGGASFDSETGSIFFGTVTVYKGTSLTPFQNEIQLGSPVINDISIDDNSPCLDAVESYCMQEGVYQFEVDLEPSNQSYFVTYQRCCRNLNVANVIDPDNTGATFTVEVTPDAQGQISCDNSSPVFNKFPDILMCVGESYELDVSASDPDGNRLEYVLCGPMAGGGPEGSQSVPGDPLGANGIAPNPDSPPPYRIIDMVPGFSPSKPLGSTGAVELDPQTGKLKLTANISGLYIIGICVKEYRGNKLIGTIRRDFQVNVVSCQAVVQAVIQHDTIIDDIFIVNSCSPVLNFVNLSQNEAYINDYSWTFELNNDPVKAKTKNLALSFPDQGQFSGSLILNEGQLCSDTAFIEVIVKPKIEADFEFSFDECSINPIQFEDRSTTGSIVMEQWIWDFGNGDSSMVPNPLKLYDQGGSYDVKLLVRDTAGCKAEKIKQINWFPVADQVFIESNTNEICIPREVEFFAISSHLNELYNIEWDFGDGGISQQLNPVHSYENPGTYQVSVDISSPTGCSLDTQYENLIEAKASPTADFGFSPEQPSTLNPTLEFINRSLDGQNYSWFVDGELKQEQEDFNFTFDTGYHQIMLIVEHPSGCLDTMIQYVDVEPRVNFFLPNAFTPNADGLNDIYQGKGFFFGIDEYRMSIYNRWGVLIFESNNPNFGWNGRLANGKWGQEGVYVVIVQFREPRGELREIKTFATLIK